MHFTINAANEVLHLEIRIFDAAGRKLVAIIAHPDQNLLPKYDHEVMRIFCGTFSAVEQAPSEFVWVYHHDNAGTRSRSVEPYNPDTNQWAQGWRHGRIDLATAIPVPEGKDASLKTFRDVVEYCEANLRAHLAIP